MAPITYSCAMPPGPRSVEYARLAQEGIEIPYPTRRVVVSGELGTRAPTVT